ncbi:active regulator of SIRT1-like [Athalia rosae]|uniref:active regulator of SIRT1-like n=1 Tax=Athalia rosae TaxID=37344 RepID=UPI002033C88E|nr:active regulator of SIRT1-like [Athalia rosae]
MSTSLVRQSLDIVGVDDDVRAARKKKPGKSQDILHMIPQNHRLLNKQGKKEAKTAINCTAKTTIGKARQKLNQKSDQTEKNIKQLLLLSSNRIDPETSDKLLNRALTRRYIPKNNEPEVPEETAFTEEDFKKFEKEYHLE